MANEHGAVATWIEQKFGLFALKVLHNADIQTPEHWSFK